MHQLLAVASELRRANTLAQSTDLLAQVEGLEAAAIKLFNDALARNNEAAAAAWFDRIIKASTFRLSVDNARPRQKINAPIAVAFAKQDAVAKVANRFIELIKGRREEGATIEHGSLDVTV
ncbi:hypothetical protein PYH37_000020 [Sinorhizobium numidicum]|uniref:Uncharacterized protein n=1 Tax=Sinorhizobium numidicum TaxID=680248 RepID=A0ABY8CVI7_9HYPH|nr:hypothetical protein [Sinorhizobium numidicum]WEX74752.1 hypothetical protein PYH37_000020 [Sinorhizobium numidicum]WEX80743.1 hypothetical protein PYH38_000022 [Sinorhizobium numidicum]